MSPSPQSWTDDAGAYRDAHRDTLERLQGLPDQLPDRLSTPEAYALSEEYCSATPRILVYGQETYHNTQAARGCSPFEAWSTQVGGAIAFDYGLSLTYHSKFWEAFDEIAAAFRLSSRRALGWANLVKVQLVQKVGTSVSISNLSPEQRMLAVRAQRDLFQAELGFFRPDAILFMTGGLSWVANHMFTEYREREQDGVTIVTTPNLPIPMVQTYHPNARVADVNGKRETAVAYLRAQLSGPFASEPNAAAGRTG